MADLRVYCVVETRHNVSVAFVGMLVRRTEKFFHVRRPGSSTDMVLSIHRLSVRGEWEETLWLGFAPTMRVVRSTLVRRRKEAESAVEKAKLALCKLVDVQEEGFAGFSSLL